MHIRVMSGQGGLRRAAVGLLLGCAMLAAPAFAAPAAAETSRAGAEPTPAPARSDLKHRQGAAGKPSTALAYPTTWQVHLPYGDARPQVARHPSGVNTVRLAGGTFLYQGDWVQIGNASLRMQWDGNLVLYGSNGAARWAADTYGQGAYACIEYDGNFRVFTSAGQPIHNNKVPTNTGGRPSHTTTLHPQADGNLVIYGPNWSVLWSTGTPH